MTARGDAAMTPEILAALDQASAARPIVLGNQPARRRATPAARPHRTRRPERSRQRRARRRRNAHGQDRRRRLVPARLQPAAAPDRGRRGAHRPGAGALRAATGFAVTVVDPRRAFATDERFPNVTVSTEWPDEAMAELRPDSRTAVVTLTHDPKLDDPALDHALKSPGVLHRRARLTAHPRGAAAAAARPRPQRPGDGPHPRPGRAEHRGGNRAGDRALHHGGGRRRASRLPLVPQEARRHEVRPAFRWTKRAAPSWRTASGSASG